MKILKSFLLMFCFTLPLNSILLFAGAPDVDKRSPEEIQEQRRLDDLKRSMRQYLRILSSKVGEDVLRAKEDLKAMGPEIIPFLEEEIKTMGENDAVNATEVLESLKTVLRMGDFEKDLKDLLEKKDKELKGIGMGGMAGIDFRALMLKEDIQSLRKKHKLGKDDAYKVIEKTDKDLAAGLKALEQGAGGMGGGIIVVQMRDVNGEITQSKTENGATVDFKKTKDGKISVTVEKDDKKAPETYEADSWKDFEKKFPEIVKDHGITEDGIGGIGGGIQFPGIQDLPIEEEDIKKMEEELKKELEKKATELE